MTTVLTLHRHISQLKKKQFFLSFLRVGTKTFVVCTVPVPEIGDADLHTLKSESRICIRYYPDPCRFRQIECDTKNLAEKL